MLPGEVDVAIVGAGAAGVGAARALAASGCSTLILEATGRVGGRARTETLAGAPLDLGCGWLHSAERNGWRAIAEASGIAVDRRRAAWGKQFRDLGFTAEEQRAAGAAFAAFDQRLRDDPPASDCAADALPPGGIWNAYLQALSGYINGVRLEQLSVADYLAYDDAASENNWRLPGGYGALVAASLPPAVPLALAAPVQAIAIDDRSLSVQTRRGAVRARAVIVTVSTGVLATGGLRLPSALDDHCQAAANLPLGLADKLFLALDNADALPADQHLIGDPRDPATGSYYLRPLGYSVVECFFGGEGAERVEREGLDGAAAFANEQLRHLLGSGLRTRLLCGSAWGHDPAFLGSYSHALPGRRAARETLARNWDQRIWFAGEATSPTDFSTAHGALASGEAAAQQVIEALRPAPPPSA